MWQYQVEGNVFSSMSRFGVEDSEKTVKIVFGCHDKRIYCFEMSETGANLCWRSELDSPIYATPFCYRSGDHIRMCVATTSGSIYVIGTDGAIVESCTMQADVFSSPVVVRSTAVFGCRNNYLYAMSVP